jgi:hypothetical protein
LHHTQFSLRIFTGKKVIRVITFLPQSIRKTSQFKDTNIMAPITPPFKINPSLCLLHSERDEGATAAVAVAKSAEKKHNKKAPGGLQTLKISNNFRAPGRRNPLQAAKLNGREIKLGMLRKRPANGIPHKMAQGREAKFPFCLDCERAYTTRSAQASPPRRRCQVR